MSESGSNGSTNPSSSSNSAKSAPEQAPPSRPPVYAPFFRAIGMPNFRFRLPSRNWTIFLTIVSSWTAAWWYDRREKKRIQQAWCDRVSYLREQTLPANFMPRKLTIVLSAPPADGLLPAREHFHEYVRPILMASGMDWDAIEGRKEGDVRAQIAERARELRMRGGEEGGESIEPEGDKIVRELREQSGVYSEDSVAGDVVIGRNTWKEYIRGLHEGWLGPLAQPKELVEVEATLETPVKTEELVQTAVKDRPVESIEEILADSEESPSSAKDLDSEKSKQEEEAKRKAEEEEAQKDKKRPQPAPFISTDAYSSATLASACPNKLGPSVAVPMPHLLGFFKTPIRMWRFLNQRKVADDVGRAVAAAVLASYGEYDRVERSTESNSTSPVQAGSLMWEQESLLANEEPEWHKSMRKRKEEDKDKESVWLDRIVMDDRIAERMCKFILPPSSDSGESGKI